MAENQNFEEWALCELFGHQRIAGKVTAVQLGGASFVRIDVPGSDTQQAITKYLNPSAIYSITPVSEETARMLSGRIDVAPVNRWDVQEMVREAARARLPQADVIHDQDDEDYEP